MSGRMAGSGFGAVHVRLKSAFTKQRIHLNRESYNVCVLGCAFAGIDIILDI